MHVHRGESTTLYDVVSYDMCASTELVGFWVVDVDLRLTALGGHVHDVSALLILILFGRGVGCSGTVA